MDMTNLEAVLKDAESIIVITEKDGEVHLSFNQELREMEVLDILATVTSKFYEIAEEDGSNPIH
jgi:predicted transcriptional regulator